MFELTRDRTISPLASAFLISFSLVAAAQPAIAQEDETSQQQEAQDEGENQDERQAQGEGERQPQVDMMGPMGAQIAGGVSIDEIRWHINRQRRALQGCFAQRIFNPQILSGRVVVTFVIGPTGVVAGASVTSSTIDDEEVEACVLRAIGLVTFPRTTDSLPLVVTYPVISREYLPTWIQPVVFASPERWTPPER